jgi:3-oxoacyl-[acyl-carrier protein] reductase
MDVSLAGRTAVITGGSKGIGLAIATQFAASGAEVAIIARGREALDDAVKTIGANGRARVVAVQGDVALAADIRRAYDEAMKLFGKIDIVVNNAGTSRTGAFEEISDEIWREDFDQKLFAAIRLTRLAWPQMKERRWGRVINTLNIGAKAPRPRSAPTSITRAAGLALTKVLAGKGAPYNVLVNALLVGFIEADQHVRAAEKAGVALNDYVSARTKDIPLGRIGRAQEFANIACFLASDAGSYITGTAINVDGGRSPVV